MRYASQAFAALLAGAVLSACASTGGGGPSYQQEYALLNTSCQERGGILVPTSGSVTGRAATDYVCDIRDGGRIAAERSNRD